MERKTGITKHHSFSYTRHGNCLLFLLYLWYLGKVSSIFVRPFWNPCKIHFIAVTPKGNILHLTRRDMTEGLNCAPLFVWARPGCFPHKLLRWNNYWRIL